MNIYTSQRNIVSKLQSDFEAIGARWKALDLPEAQNQYQIAVPNETVYVIYHGSNADPSISTDVIAQQRKVSFNVEIGSRTLYDANGVMTIRDIVEQSLIGLKPANCQRLYLVKDDLSITDDKIWVHVLQFECITMLMQKDESDPIVVPSFQELVSND
jgi:hypothetical protein